MDIEEKKEDKKEKKEEPKTIRLDEALMYDRGMWGEDYVVRLLVTEKGIFRLGTETVETIPKSRDLPKIPKPEISKPKKVERIESYIG